MNTYTLYGNPESFLSRGTFNFGKYGFEINKDKFYAIETTGTNSQYKRRYTEIDKNSKEYADFKKYLKDGVSLREDEINKRLKAVFESGKKPTISPTFISDNISNTYASPYVFQHGRDKLPQQAHTVHITQQNPHDSDYETTILCVDNAMLQKRFGNLFASDDPEHIKRVLNTYVSDLKDRYDYHKNLSYGLEGETELIIENSFGEIYNTIGPFLEKNKNITFIDFLKKHKIGTLLKNNPTYESILLNPAFNMEKMTDYLNNRREEYLDYKCSTSYENFIKDANKSVARHLADGTSVLLKEFTGPFYTVNQSELKPFTGINQILTRQHIADKNLENMSLSFSKPNSKNKFYPVGRDGEQLGVFLSVFDKKKGRNEENVYYSHGQLRTDNDRSSLVKTVKPKALGCEIPPLDCNSKDEQKILETNVKNFIIHSFQNSTYKPSPSLMENKRAIARLVQDGKIDLTHTVNEAFKYINDNKNKKNELSENNSNTKNTGRKK